MPPTALEKLLEGTQTPVRMSKQPEPKSGTLNNPMKVNAAHQLAKFSLICRVLSFVVGGLKPGVETPGQACPGEVLTPNFRSYIKSQVPKDSWFEFTELEGKSSNNIDFKKNIFHWDGERIDRFYDKEGKDVYDIMDNGEVYQRPFA